MKKNLKKFWYIKKKLYLCNRNGNKIYSQFNFKKKWQKQL